MQDLLKRALLPNLSLLDALKGWRTICQRLAEPPRKRQKQRNKLRFI
jgi:hypothetical protein